MPRLVPVWSTRVLHQSAARPNDDDVIQRSGMHPLADRLTPDARTPT
jgi:hypothetical protein